MKKANAQVDKSSNRKLKPLAWLTGIFILIQSVTGILLFNLNLPVYGSVGFFTGNPFTPIGIGYGIVGLLILSYKPRHRIGWLFLGISLMGAIEIMSKQYAVYGLLITRLPGAGLMAWIHNSMEYLIFPGPILLLFLIFPNGQLPSRRWRPIVWLAIISTISLSIGTILAPGIFVVYLGESEIPLGIFNQTGRIGWEPIIDILTSAWFISVLLIFPTLFAPIWRYRNANMVEKKQLKWLAFPAILTLLMLIPLMLMDGGNSGEIILAAIVFLPAVATAIAILKHQLYDIDIIIKRTLVYGLLTAILGTIYFSSVVFIQTFFTAVTGQQSPVAIVLSTLIIAVLFTPLRGHVQILIDRRFYRAKYDAAQTLARFAASARDEVSLENLTAELTNVVQETMQPNTLSIWLGLNK